MLSLAESYPDIRFETHENRIALNGRAKMGIQNFSEHVLLVDLPFEEPQTADGLKNVNEITGNRDGCNVIIGFFRVEVITF